MIETKYDFKSVGANGKVEPYSPKFDSLGAANQWYRKHGIHAERVLGRKLIFSEYRDYKAYNKRKQPNINQKKLPFGCD